MALSDYDPVINEAAQSWNLDPNLLRSLILQESGGNPRAVSKKGAFGLTGLMPTTATNLGVTDPKDTTQQIYGGAAYLSQALDAEKGNPQAALLYYHGGPDWRGAYGPESAGYVPGVAQQYARVTKGQQTSAPAAPGGVPSDDEFLNSVAPSAPKAAASSSSSSVPSDDDFLNTVAPQPAAPATSAAPGVRPVAGTPSAPASANPLASSAPMGNPLVAGNALGGDQFIPTGAPPNTDANDYARISNALAPAPNTTYGNILPFARDNATGAIRPALPMGWRDLAQGVVDLAYGPNLGTVTPRGTMALTNIVPNVMGSPANGTAEAVSTAARLSAAPRVEPSLTSSETPLISQEFAENPGVTTPQTITEAGPTSTNALTTQQPPENALSTAAPRTSFPIPQTSDDAKKIASIYYTQADKAGGELTPEFANKFVDKAQNLAPQTPEGQAVVGNSAITDMAARLEALRDKPISLAGAQEIDEGIGNLIDKEWSPQGLSKDGKNLLDLQSTFRDSIRNAGPVDTVGGTEGFDALKNARGAYSQAMKMQDLERIQSRAAMTDNPATGVKSGIRTLLSNPTRSRGYSPEEISALQDAGNRGALGGILHVFGSRLIPLATGAAGTPGGVLGALGGAAAGYGASTLMRNAASALQAKRLSNALSTLGEGVPGTSAPLAPWYSPPP